MIRKISVVIALALGLAACSQETTTKIATAVQVGCALDGTFVPIGQDAAAVLAPAVGATNEAAGTLLMGAVDADKAMVHPAVMAVCKSLLGDKASTAVVAKPDVPVPSTPAPAAPVAASPVVVPPKS